MSKKQSKNLQKVQDMLDGNYKNKIQVGYSSQDEKREIGDKWVDSDGNHWEQRDGYKTKNTSNVAHHSWDMKCQDCEKLILKKRDVETYNRMHRCFYCQLDFEVMLKSKKIGHKGTKWDFWVKLQELRRWETIDKEIDQLVIENSEVKWNDKKFLNALANDNVEMNIKANRN
tara:strand:+ start:153 stop:668 length:516 start_codon:yes stop_codon:yes gene_type:complete